MPNSLLKFVKSDILLMVGLIIVEKGRQIMKNLSYLMVMLGAILWGTLGIFVSGLSGLGFDSINIVTLRVISASILMFIYIMIYDRNLFKIKIKDTYLFVGTGIMSIVFFNWCYFIAMKETSYSVAAILLYTAPAFVMILSKIFFNEIITVKKILSLFMTFGGCILITGLLGSKQAISFYGLIVGLGSGFGYALYSIFGKVALRKYNSITISFYSFLFAAISLIPFGNYNIIAENIREVNFWVYVISLGLFPTVLAFLLYTKGLNKIESSKASIIATVEPVVATVIAVIAFGEVLSIQHIFGIVLVISAIFIVKN